MTTLYSFKVVLIGESGVGKSSILNRHVQGCFNPIHNSTIGVDYASKSQIYDIPGTPFTDCKYIYQLWDTAGQDRFDSIVTSYFHHATAAIFVFDLCNIHSFQALDKWFDKLEAVDPDIVKILVGNKCDLISQLKPNDNLRVITRDEAHVWAEMHDCQYIECSAKNDVQVEQVFSILATEIFRKIASGKPVRYIKQIEPAIGETTKILTPSGSVAINKVNRKCCIVQ